MMSDPDLPPSNIGDPNGRLTDQIVRRQSQYYPQKLVRSNSMPTPEAVTLGRFSISSPSGEVFTSGNVGDQKMPARTLG